MKLIKLKLPNSSSKARYLILLFVILTFFFFFKKTPTIMEASGPTKPRAALNEINGALPEKDVGSCFAENGNDNCP